jgi:hypothetical protein
MGCDAFPGAITCRREASTLSTRRMTPWSPGHMATVCTGDPHHTPRPPALWAYLLAANRASAQSAVGSRRTGAKPKARAG